MRNTAIGAAILALLGGVVYFGAQPKPLDIDTVKAQQAAYFKQHGEYQKRGKGELAPNVNVQTYDGPQGKGYILIQENPEATIITDFGPEGRSQTIHYASSSTGL